MDPEEIKSLSKYGAARELVLGFARGQCTVTDPDPYYADACRELDRRDWPTHWCGIFCLWALHQAGLALDWQWEIGRGFLYQLAPPVLEPAAGDVAYFPNSKFGSPVQHHAIVESLDGYQLTTIDGNTNRGRFERGQVLRKSRDVRIYDPTPSYYSISSLLPKEPSK